MAEINYYSCIKRAYPTITDADFTLEQDENGLHLHWYNEAIFGVAPALSSLESQWLPIVKQQALLEVKDIRRQGLDKAALSAGIYAIYEANYEAAINFLAGSPEALMKNGMDAESYLTEFGARLQMTANQFATYIIAENQRVGPVAFEVEKRYLALTYAGDANAGIIPINYLPNVTAVENAVAAFRTFCAL